MSKPKRDIGTLNDSDSSSEPNTPKDKIERNISNFSSQMKHFEKGLLLTHSRSTSDIESAPKMLSLESPSFA